MIRHLLLGIAVLIILIANAAALLHVAQNRTAPASAEVSLTQRELSYWSRGDHDEDSSIILHLNSHGSEFGWNGKRIGGWLNQTKLKALGFDVSVALNNDADSRLFYQRQRGRRAFVAFEYDGPAWRRWIADCQTDSERVEKNTCADAERDQSRLFAIDADLDPAALRARHLDRSRVLIVPAVVTIWPDYQNNVLVGYVNESPSSISVPPLFAESFRSHIPRQSSANEVRVKYVVHLRYGRSFEPWITGVDWGR